MCDVLEKPAKLLLSVLLPQVVTHLSLISNCIVKAGRRHIHTQSMSEVTPGWSLMGFS